MVESKILINKKPIKYTGIFRIDELHAVLKRFFQERQFIQVEFKTNEVVKPSGKVFFLELMPYRKMSDYAKKQFHIEIYMHGLTQKVVEIDGRKEQFDHAEILVLSTLKMVTDWRQRFEGTGFYFLLRTFLDKFIRFDVIREIEDEAVKDFMDLQGKLNEYLSAKRFKTTDPGGERMRVREAE
ncbi:MAG: hypothetical protein OXR66_05860 [Candidatus Woesearchaeota archaeon]|nr:hypothetical protein [Candidatus Woesearchaeota archaeon]